MFARFAAGLGAAAALFMSAHAQDAVEVEDEEPPSVDALVGEVLDVSKQRSLTAYVDGLADAVMRAEHLPGMTISIVKNGEVLLARGYGYADLEAGAPVDPETSLFEIGSVSKTFVWTAAMMLAERGLLDLDADVNDYLDDMEVSAGPRGAPVTMNALMAHRSGYEETYLTFTIPDDVDADLGETLAEHQPARVFAPGRTTAYSNYATGLAAHVIEAVTGAPYETFLREEIIEPLGMDRVTLYGRAGLSEADRARRAKGYGFRDGGSSEVGYLAVGPYWPVGGIAASAVDMTPWMLVHLGEGTLGDVRLMSPETHRAMWTPAFDDRPGGLDLAHGWMTDEVVGVRTFGHGGSTDVFLTRMKLAPALDAGVFVSVNGSNGRAASGLVADRVIERLAREAGLAEPVETAPVEGEAALDDYAGEYLTTRRAYRTMEKFLQMQPGAYITVAPGEGGALVVAAGGEKRRLERVVGETDVFAAPEGDARVVFLREDGAVTGLVAGSGTTTYHKAGPFDRLQTVNLAAAAAFFFSLTMLVGAWRRQGRDVDQSILGGAIGAFDLLIALAVFAGFALAVMGLQELEGLEVAELAVAYPPPAVRWVVFAGWLWAGAAFFALVLLPPALAGSGWSIWRRGHHLLFAAALCFFAYMLMRWNVIVIPGA